MAGPDNSGARPSGGAGGRGRPRTGAAAGKGARPDRPAGSGTGRPVPRAGQGGGAPERAQRPGGSGPAPQRRGASPEEIAQRTYDPRREERRKATRVALPEDVDPRMLDPEARRELRSLSKETADLVARHLVVTGQLLDEDPAQALAHARAARALAGRVGVVREAAGLAAYAAGEWSEALSELRAARRITGRPEHLAVFADCERALGRPERALAYGDDPQVAQLGQDERVELVIVLAGARRDLGQADAAVLALQDPARRTSERRPWAPRLWYAYADALLDAGRQDQAQEWFAKAAAVDVEGQTDAGDRLLALEGVVLPDDDEEEGQERADLPSDAELADLVRDMPPLQDPAAPLQDRAAPTQEAASADGAEQSAPVTTPPASGVAAPTFVAPPSAPGRDEDGGADDTELRLFD